MFRWALGIPPEHSDFECSDGHWAFHRRIQGSDVHRAFHRSIQISNAHMRIVYTHDYFMLVLIYCTKSYAHWGFTGTFDAQMCIGRFSGAVRFPVLIWALGIPPEHSDFECSDGHWTFHRSIQISNAQMGISHSTGAFRFSMLRWALGVPPRHSDFECSYAHWAFTGTFDAQMCVEHSARAYIFPMLIWALGIPPEHSDFQCSDVHRAFHRSIQI